MDMIMEFVGRGSPLVAFPVGLGVFAAGIFAAMQLEMRWGYLAAVLAAAYLGLRLYMATQ